MKKKGNQKKIFFSIIIPVLNDKIGLEKTLNSISKQKCQDFEIIVVDGGSTDQTQKIITKYKKIIKKYINEKDRGIYDAINKGIKISSGRFINTINANDTYYNIKSLEIAKEYIIKNNYDFLFGAVLKNKIYYKFEPQKMWWSFNFYPAHSGGFFVKKAIHKKIGLYSLKYPCSSDYDFFWKLIIKHNFLGGPTSQNDVISIFESGGFSSKYSFFEHVIEETLIRINNKQNKIVVLTIFFLRIIKSFSKI